MIDDHDNNAYVVNYNDPPDPLLLEPDDFFFFLTAVPAISLLTMVSRLGSTSRHTLMGTWAGNITNTAVTWRRLQRWSKNITMTFTLPLHCSLPDLNLGVDTLLELDVLADLLRVQVGHLHRLPVAVLVAGDAKIFKQLKIIYLN